MKRESIYQFCLISTLAALAVAAPSASAAPNLHQLLFLEDCVDFANNCEAGDLTLGTTGHYSDDSACADRSSPMLESPSSSGVSSARSFAISIAAISLVDSIEAGERQWIATQTALVDPAFLRRERNRCSAEAGSLGRECAYRLELDLARTGRTGMIRDASAAASSSASPACREYAACVAEASVGRTLPLPSSAPARIGIRHDFVAIPFNTRLLEPGALTSLARALAADLRRARDMNPSTFDAVMLYRMRNEETVLRHVEALRAECGS